MNRDGRHKLQGHSWGDLDERKEKGKNVSFNVYKKWNNELLAKLNENDSSQDYLEREKTRREKIRAIEKRGTRTKGTPDTRFMVVENMASEASATLLPRSSETAEMPWYNDASTLANMDILPMPENSPTENYNIITKVISLFALATSILFSERRYLMLGLIALIVATIIYNMTASETNSTFATTESFGTACVNRRMPTIKTAYNDKSNNVQAEQNFDLSFEKPIKIVEGFTSQFEPPNPSKDFAKDFAKFLLEKGDVASSEYMGKRNMINRGRHGINSVGVSHQMSERMDDVGK